MEVPKEMIVVLLTFIFLLLIKIESVTCSERDVRFVKESRSDFDNDVRRIPLRPPEVLVGPKKMFQDTQSVGVEFSRSVDNERTDDIRGSVSDLERNSSNSMSDNLKKDPGGVEENSPVQDSGENSRFAVTRLAQCRATCVGKSNLKLKKIGRSLKKTVVNTQDIQIAFEQCWDTCMRLEIYMKKQKQKIKEMSRTTLMCQTNTNCLSGCMEACEFHQDYLTADNNKRTELFAGVKVEPILSISGLKKTDKKKLFQLDLAWPGPSDEDEPVVYSVIQHVVVRVNSTPTWRLLAQTIKVNISLTFPVKVEKSGIRVLATSPTRLVRVFSSVKVGAENGISNDDGDDVVAKGEPIRSPQPAVNASALQESASRQRDEEHNVVEDWHLSKLSMIHRNFLVLTQITWNSRVYDKAGATTVPNVTGPTASIHLKGQTSSLSGAPVAVSDQSVKDTKRKFLLTWQEDGGLLKGNMVTDTNSVSISLLPNTQYLIQVGLIESDAGAAEEDESNPWDSPVQPVVSNWSPFLKVNTSEAPEAINGKSNSNSSQAQQGESKTESILEDHNVDDHLPHHLQASLISSKRGEEVSGHRRLRYPSSGKPKEYHHDESERTLFGVTCECSGGRIGTKWCCQTLIVSFVLVLFGIYGLLILLSCLFYISFYFFKLSPHQLAKDFFSWRSSLTVKLVEHEEHGDDQDEVQHDSDDSLRKGLGMLSQYNIV